MRRRFAHAECRAGCSRRPERTVLYQAVQAHLETWLAQKAAQEDAHCVPLWVEREFREFLRCGILAPGVARARCGSCGQDFVVGFSCKTRCLCPSCNARRMVEVAAHLVDHVFPRVPVRQWVLALPKRLGYFVQREAELVGEVLRVFLRAVEPVLRKASLGAPPDAGFGGVSFVQRFGASLNAHLHFHICLVDGVFSTGATGFAEDAEPIGARSAPGGELSNDGTVEQESVALRFHEATALGEAEVVALQEVVRKRLLALFERRGLLTSETVAEMGRWEHGGGFSLDASIRVAPNDRAGLERLLRYCARPAFARERLCWSRNGEQLLYQFPKPRPDGQTMLPLDPIELLDRLASLVPPPRSHRHRYCGVLAPNARLRPLVTARAGLPVEITEAEQAAAASGGPDTTAAAEAAPTPRSRCSSLWAALPARIYEVFPLICPRCGQEIRIIAFITERATIDRILSHIGNPSTPPPIAPARAPPPPDLDQTAAYDFAAAEPAPEFDFEQTVPF